jgi:hypothetical protein
MRQRIFRTVKAALLTAGLAAVAVLALPQRSSAGSLSSAVIGMFPKDAGEFAYADLKSARQFSWFPQLREQLLPARFREFEQFLTSAGMDPNTQVDEVVWAQAAASKSGGDQLVGIALGSFDPGAVETHFKQQKLPSIEIQGYHLYAFGSGAAAGDILFLFLDSNTVAFGHRTALEKLIDVRMGSAESITANDKLYPLISETNGGGIIWAVLDDNYTHLAMQQLLPQAAQIPQAVAIINRMRAMTINVEADSGVDAHFQAVCGSVDDANLLNAALQAGLMLRRAQEAQSNPALASALNLVRVTPSGDRLKVDAPISQDQLLSLIQSHMFAAPM